MAVALLAAAPSAPAAGVLTPSAHPAPLAETPSVLAVGTLALSAPAAQPGPPVTFAERELLASRSLLLAIAPAGQRLVAVGERGHILLSDDQGQTWSQAESVPTRSLLTAVCFGSDGQGVAVGHDEVILTTRDAGRTWMLAHFAPQAQQPLLDVACATDGHVIAVGAYGVYFSSPDGGANWRERKFAALPAKAAAAGSGSVPGAARHEPATGAASPRQPATDAAARQAAANDAGHEPVADDIPRDLHLNRIAAASPARLYIAAEGGHVYRTDDGGETWHELPSPYAGSFFGVKPLQGDVVLAYGLRGNLFRSEDAGASWRKVETGTHAMLNDAVSVGTEGATVVVGLSGVVLVSRDEGRSFNLMQQEDRKGLSAAIPVASGTLVVVGEGGARRINIAPGIVTAAGSVPP